MDAADLSQVATLLRSVSGEVFNGKGKLCLSANYLHKFNSAFDENMMSENTNVSFHIVQTSNLKTNLMRDIQFLFDLVQRTIRLKVIPDIDKDFINIDITRFKNIQILEIHKLDIQVVLGIQKLRSQLQELTCCHSIKCLSDILDKCGGDYSQRYSWNELKKANFSHNKILELDDSIKCTLSLHTLDLSHNELSNVDILCKLPNLKHLNIAYNKLDSVPRFRGQICNRLQVLVLNNNFIEDLHGLTSLINIMQLDLSQNCLLDHKSLLSVSHLSSLQWLNLQGNPFSFHPLHRNLTCNYLNKNNSTLKFVLDNIPLNKLEKSLTGSLYPVLQNPPLYSVSSNSSLESSNCSVQEKFKKIRNVTIEDDGAIKQRKTPVLTPIVSSQHLEIKKQVEYLREEYGESWLHQHSGLLVQDVLGFEKTPVLSSTPYESAVDLSLPGVDKNDLNSESTPVRTLISNSATSINDTFETANDETDIFNNTVQVSDDESDISDGEDVIFGGEECIYLVTNKAENISDNQVFVVITETHISERDVTTSKEKARWHKNTIVSCDKSNNNQNIIKLEFDTLRRDRKQRIYELDADEIEIFYTAIKNKIDTEKLVEKKVMYQCMKCSKLFSKKNNTTLLDEPSVTCPQCMSNLVVENM